MPIAPAEEGEQLVNPPAAVVKPIEQFLRSPLKQRVSVVGRILQEEGIKTVNVRGTDVNIRNIVIQDVSGKAKVCLWRDASNANARTGQSEDFKTYIRLAVQQVDTLSEITNLASAYIVDYCFASNSSCL
ncbi:hypothetical protein ACF0H5_008602 [Mactra antiquata]